ncbi:MAG: TIGR01620 family protein [Pseudomonadota bacterium]
MSRKPTAISLDAEPKSDLRKGAKVTDKKPRKAAKQETTASKAKSSDNGARRPVAMAAPDASQSIDVFDPDSDAYVDAVTNHIPLSRRRSIWMRIFIFCTVSLLSLGTGLWFMQTVEALFARNIWLGWLAAVLLGLLIISLVVGIVREIVALWRLRKLNRLREQVISALNVPAQSSPEILDDIVSIYQDREDMNWPISRLASHELDVMDLPDRLLLAERILMKPLDEEAKQIIAKAAKRISVVTAINPAASLDVIFTGYQVLRMLRQLTALYGNRPGSLGTLKLARMVGSHLAVTGGLALSDTLVQQFVGKGIAGRLSAKLGEGTVNGIFTARIGLAALDLCRPMPFEALEKPGLKEFISTLAGSLTKNSDQDTPAS